MPELPEVETVRRTLESEVQGKTIASVELYRDKNISTSPEEFVSKLRGKKILSLGRKGKWLRFHLSEGLVILSHLRMEGKFYYFSSISPKEKHDILRFRFEDGTSLVYNDTRKFGRLALYKEDELQNAPSYRELGPEPWDIEPEELLCKLKKKSGPIKEALLDQSMWCGLGNIYADETLFASKIHPLFPADQICLEEASALVLNARRILEDALHEGGSTVRSYHPGLGIDGKMQSRLLVYGRALEPCLRCGHTLFKIEVGGRGSTFCPHCQHYKGRPYVLAVTGPIHSGKSSVASFFASKGCHLFNADEVAKKAYSDPNIGKKVILSFGEKSYRGEKPSIPYLRKCVASSKENKTKINSIIHPYVFEQAERFISSFSENDSILLDVPLLLDAGMQALCDDILLVDSSLETRINRLEELGQDTSKMTKINSDYPLSKTEKYATFVVENNGSFEELQEKLEEIHRQINRGEPR